MFNRIRQSIASLIAPRDARQHATDLVLRANQMIQQRASFDASRHSDEFKNYWANADRYDADSAHSKGIRHTLIARSRYEVGNNAYADGIAQTKVNDLIGVGPSLRMQSGSEGFNRMVELSFHLWSEAIGLRGKLWTLAHAKHVDGEGFAIVRRNPGVNHPVKFDLQLVEAEQVQSPELTLMDDGYIDGVRFDEYGNAIWYDLLKRHPGSTQGLFLDTKP
jgi:capsid protein